MNILLINHYAGSLQHGMEYRPYYFAREWKRSGHNPVIVAASTSHVRTLAPECRGHWTEEVVDGIPYVWLRTSSYQTNGLRRAINMFSFVAQLYRFKNKLASWYQPDVVIASSTYPLDIFPAYAVAKSTGARLVFEVHDLWPLSPIELGGMSKNHPFIRILQYAEDYAYRNSDRVVSILPKASEYMSEHGMAAEKFVHVPNGIDLTEWVASDLEIPEPHRSCLQEVKEQGKFLVGYAGAHGLANGLIHLVHAAEVLKDEPVMIVLVGQGPEKETLEKTALKKGLTNILFLPPIPKQAIPALLRTMDCLYLGLNKVPIFRFGVSPNKLMDYMMSAKPIIYAIEAGNDMVADSQAGFSIPAEDQQAIADAIIKMMFLSSEEREAMGQRGQQYIVARHDYRVLAGQFLDLVM